MRLLGTVLCLLCLVFLATTVIAGPVVKSSPGCSACHGAVCKVPVEVRVERAAVVAKTKAVAKAVVVKTEAAAEKVGKGGLRKWIQNRFHRRGK